MIDSVLNLGSTIIDKIFPDAEDAAKAKLKLLELEQKGELAKIAAQSNIIMAEANSKDKWTSRARPTFMYVFYFILLLLALGSVVSVWHPKEVQQAAQTFSTLFSGIPEPMWWAFTAGYLGYTGARTYEKRKNITK